MSSSIWGAEKGSVRETPLNFNGPTVENGLLVVDDNADWNEEFHLDSKEHSICTDTNYTPEPRGECKRITTIKLRGSSSITTLPHGVTFIFVQSKEAACIVTRDFGKEKKIHDLQLDFSGLAGALVLGQSNFNSTKTVSGKEELIFNRDPRLRQTAILGVPFELPAEIYPYDVVSALLRPDGLDEEKGSKPSSHKESSSRPLNEEAAINFLNQKLRDDGFKETIQTAISALRCLYQENVRADEIVVYTANIHKSQKFLSREEIEMHLESSST